MNGGESAVTHDLRGKVAVVTGGGKGVGAAISRELADRGAHVVVNYFHSEPAAHDTVDAIRRAGGSAQAVRASVAKRSAVEKLFAAVAAEHGGVDILVNNAAWGVFARYDDLTDKEWQRALDVNVHGARWCALAAAESMARRGGGVIVNVSSIGAGLAMDDYMLVGVCKAAVEAMTRYLAADLGPLGIRVNSASGGLLNNPTARLFPRAEGLRETCAAAAPLGRVGTEEDLAGLVGFLASPRASWISGQSYLADGGLSVGRAMLTAGPARPAAEPAAAEPAAAEPTPAEPGAAAERTPVTAYISERSEHAARAHDHDARAVAVVGMGLVAPGAGDPVELWKRLTDGEPAFSEPEERFEVDHFYSPDPDAPDRSYCRVGGWVRRQADPGEDMLAAWLRGALLQCSLPNLLRGPDTRTALFLGGWAEGSQHVEESLLVEAAVDGLAAHWARLADPAALRARLRAALRRHYPYAGRLTGHFPLASLNSAIGGLLPPGTPVVTVDTACSSSLYAVDLAAKSVLDEECELALAGGGMCLGPRTLVLFSKLHGLSRSGQVHCLDPRADGVLSSEGAGFLALKRLDRARADGDPILGVLAGFGAASDGRGKAPHTPNPTGQRRAVARALGVNSLPAQDVSWVIAHATGTPVGDGVERGVLAELLPDVVCTSNKSLVGHTGWTAGVLSAIHALKGLEHGVVPAQSPCRPQPGAVPKVPETPVPLPASPATPRTVGVSAFGFGGTNAHLLLREAPAADATPPRAQRDTVADDPVVLVAWSAQLPGAPSAEDIARRLAEGLPPSAARDFGTPYPTPPLSEVKLPPATSAAIDPAHLMVLQATARLLRPEGRPLWEGLTESTGVFAAHTGVPGSSADVSVRCYASSLASFASGYGGGDDGLDAASLTAAAESFVSAVRERCPATSEVSYAGLLPNVIPGRVAATHDLHGLAMTIDTGPTSGRTALTTAAKYLLRGELDLALVIGANSGSGPLYARVHELPDDAPAQGAFAVALTRTSVAWERRWAVLCRLDDALAKLPDRMGFARPRTYLAADDLIDVIRHASGAPAADGPARDGSAVPAPPRQTRRHVAHWIPAGTAPSPGGRTAPPGHTLVIADPDGAETLRPVVRADASSRLLILRPGDDPQGALEAFLDEHSGGLRNLRIVATAHHGPGCSALPGDHLRALHEAAFLAVQRLHGALACGGTLGFALLTKFSGAAPNCPHVNLFTGLGKTLAWEMPGCATRVLLTDTRDARTALTALDGELRRTAEPADPEGLPVVVHRDGTRAFQRLRAAEHEPGLLPLKPGAVVVATGGARGITAACLLGLAERIPLRVHVIGTSTPGDVPPDLLAADDAELPRLRARFIAEQRGERPDRSVREITARFDRLVHARESHRTLALLRDRCGTDNVHFHTCDVTNAHMVRTTAALIREREDRIDLLIHGAGLHNPGDITRKDLAGMRRIRDVKLHGYHHLHDAFTGTHRPRLWCNFGSVTGLFGMPGESDYAPANDFLAGAALAAGPGGGEYTIAWTIWDETGLGSGAIAQAYAARTAQLTRMSTEEGVAHFLDELSRGPEPRLVTFIGDDERRTLHERFPGFITSAAPTAQPGLLGAPHRRSGDEAYWELTLSMRTHAFLHDHLVDGKPTLPGVMLVDIALQAAAVLVPGALPNTVEDLTFSAWIRARTDGTPSVYGVLARRVPHRGQDAVEVVIRSDTTAPDGRVLVRDREHFRATVPLTATRPPTHHPIHTGDPWRAVEDPYYHPDSPVQLTGPFRATRDCRSGPNACGSRWQPDPDSLDRLPDLATPPVLLDSLARTSGLAPDEQGRQTVFVPRRIRRITVHWNGRDGEALQAHHNGILLRHDPENATSTACTPQGQVLAEVVGLEQTVLARLGPHRETAHAS